MKKPTIKLKKIERKKVEAYVSLIILGGLALLAFCDRAEDNVFIYGAGLLLVYLLFDKITTRLF